MRVALLQTVSRPHDVAGNLARLAEACAAADADLLVTPEMFLTGYDIGADAVAALAEPADGPSADAVAAIARTSGTAVLYGYPERHGGRVANAVALVGPDGTRLAGYRKTHLFGALDRACFTASDTPPAVVTWNGWGLGLLVCYDVEFPETVRAAALSGADAVIVPTAQMEPYAHIAERLIPVRAWENQVHVVYVNRTGTEGDLTYVGRSSIVSPEGVVLDSLGPTDTGLLIATIDPEATRRARRENPYLADRRTDLY